MQCEICKIRTATVHLTEIVDGHRSESHLCQNCAQKEGITMKNQLSLNELLSSLIAAHQQADEQNEIENQISCPVCGMTMELFRKQALLGCPKDYEVFEKILQPIIEKAHDGKLIHKGKIPASATGTIRSNSITKKDETKMDSASSPQVEEIKKRLEKAIRDEDYELAAKLRDQLKALQ
jgi:protein arginine kinase activator